MISTTTTLIIILYLIFAHAKYQTSRLRVATRTFPSGPYQSSRLTDVLRWTSHQRSQFRAPWNKDRDVKLDGQINHQYFSSKIALLQCKVNARQSRSGQDIVTIRSRLPTLQRSKIWENVSNALENNEQSRPQTWGLTTTDQTEWIIIGGVHFDTEVLPEFQFDHVQAD